MPYLPLAVKSILNQSYKNFEFIVIDDASTDKTSRYLKNLKDKRVKIFRNKKNLGLAKSLNIAISKSKGAYIARMDSDDISNPLRFENQIKFLLEHPKIDLCGTWVNLIDEKGKIIGKKTYPTDPEKVKKSLLWYTAVVHPTFLAKRSFFEKLSGYREDFDLAEDYDLLSRARQKFCITNLPEKLLLWRLSKNRRSRKTMDQMDKIDLKIKLESLKREGLSPFGILSFLRKLIVMYTIPSSIKYRLAIFFKLA